MSKTRQIRLKDRCSIKIEDVFPNPTKDQLRKWKEMGEDYLEDWIRTYHSECVKMLKEEFEDLYETIKN